MAKYQVGDKVEIDTPLSDYNGSHVTVEAVVDGFEPYYAVTLPDGEEGRFPESELLAVETVLEADDVVEVPRTAYLAGPITNEPKWREYFDAAAEHVRKLGFHVINPAEQEGELSREVYMAQDFAKILASNVFFLLPGWENSEGALVEFQVAQQAGKDIRYLDGAFRGEPLELTASKLVRNGAREQTYGHPINDMERFTIVITGLLQGYLRPGVRIPAAMGPVLMLGLKLSRAANDPAYRDTRTDIIGWGIVFDRVMQEVGGNHD